MGSPRAPPMKNVVCTLLLLSAALPLSAQIGDQIGGRISIYVPPVTGIGISPEDNEYIWNLLTAEVKARDFDLAASRGLGCFSLIGYLMTEYVYFAFHEDIINIFYTHFIKMDPDNSGHVLHLVLQSNSTGEVIAEQDLIYHSLNDVKGFLPLVSFHIFSVITETRFITKAVIDDSWRNKRMYFGASVFWTPRIYHGEHLSVFYGNFGLGLSAEFHFAQFLSVGTGIELAPDWIVSRTGDHRDIVMGIPLSLMAVFRPSSFFMLKPYIGIHFNFSLAGATNPPLLSWRAGFQYGVKAGGGVFFIEPRFSADFGSSSISRTFGAQTDIYRYQRYAIHIGIGFKWGAGNRE